MTFKIGIVGKPSSGKSTFLNAACLTDAKTAPHPFTTIKPNLGTAWLRAECPHAERPCKPRAGKCVDGIRLIPVPLVDVAGLVPGAHAGKGMGNQFLSDLADADALVHVVDASGRTDAEGQPTKGHDPAGDVRFLEDELDWWIAGIIKKDWAVTRRKAELKAFKLEAEVARQLSGLRVSPEQVEAAMKKIGFTTSADDSKILELAREVRVLSKPIVIAANKCDLPEARANVAKLPGAVPCSAEAEYALRKAAEAGAIEYVPGAADFKVLNASEQQQKALGFIREKVLNVFGSTGVQQVIDRTVRDVLGVVVAYPVEDEGKLSDKKGNVLPDAFLMPRGATALDLAFRVHTDVGKAFKGAIDCRTGKRVGKEHLLREGDVLKILV